MKCTAVHRGSVGVEPCSTVQGPASSVLPLHHHSLTKLSVELDFHLSQIQFVGVRGSLFCHNLLVFIEMKSVAFLKHLVDVVWHSVFAPLVQFQQVGVVV